MLDTIITIAVYGGLILLIRKLILHYRYHRSDVKFFRIYSGVHDLEQIVSQLEQLEEIQTSIELAKFHHLKGVTIELPDNLGQEHGHTLLINGHDRNSKALMQLVIDERDRLRDTLLKKIKELDTNGTTQLRPDLVAKELLEVSTMRARGAHFSPLSPEGSVDPSDVTVHNKTKELNFFFAGENAEEEGEDE